MKKTNPVSLIVDIFFLEGQDITEEEKVPTVPEEQDLRQSPEPETS